MKRKIGYILLFLSGLNIAPCFWSIFTILTRLFSPNHSIGIIGGADGPTAIFLTRVIFNLVDVICLIIGIVCLIASIILLKTKKPKP